jgi:hypothetical protein
MWIGGVTPIIVVEPAAFITGLIIETAKMIEIDSATTSARTLFLTPSTGFSSLL